MDLSTSKRLEIGLGNEGRLVTNEMSLTMSSSPGCHCFKDKGRLKGRVLVITARLRMIVRMILVVV